MRLFRLVISTFVAVFFYCGCVLLHSLDRVSRHLGKRRSRSCAGAKSWPNCWLELPLCFAVSCQSKAELLRSPDN